MAASSNSTASPSRAQVRLARVAGHLSAASVPRYGGPAAGANSINSRADDVVIVSALRTPIGRARRGALAQTNIEDMLAPVLSAVCDRPGFDKALVGDITVGTVLGDGSQRANQCRMAGFLAGFPETVPIHTVNRQCSSGLQALAHIASAIKAGYIDAGVAAGVESMSSAKFSWSGSQSKAVMENKQARDCLIPMGVTSENVASEFGVTRKEQDDLAVLSHARAAAATKSGRFRDEIVPVQVELKDPKTGEVKKFRFERDGGIREGTTAAKLGKLKAVFKEGGSTTAGNASQVSDGASAVLAMRRSLADKLGMPVLGVFRGFAVAGVAPHVMGIGPAVAIPMSCENAGLKVSDIDLFEINEAFASQATYCVRELGLSMDKVNVNGGAIALGHPLGCTGARMTATLLHEMAKRKSRYGVVSMCIGSGMGASAVFERE